MLLVGVDKVFRDAIAGHSLKGMDAHCIVLTDDSLTSAMHTYTKWSDQHLLNINRGLVGSRGVQNPIMMRKNKLGLPKDVRPQWMDVYLPWGLMMASG